MPKQAGGLTNTVKINVFKTGIFFTLKYIDANLSFSFLVYIFMNYRTLSFLSVTMSLIGHLLPYLFLENSHSIDKILADNSVFNPTIMTKHQLLY